MGSHEVIENTEFPRHRRFVFGDFVVDLDRGTLTCNGEAIAVRPKSFAVLEYLLEHAGRLVPREELLDAVWQGIVVTDDSVAQCLTELRKALGDDKRTMIRTVPRRGLVFDVPVRVDASARPSSVQRIPRKTWRTITWQTMAAASAILAAVLLSSWWLSGRSPAPASDGAKRTAVAVLRFVDMSPPPGYSWLADGFSEEILHMLAQSPSLAVIARTSSFSVEGQPVDAIADRLGVSHILEGSIRREGNQVRITAQLIDAATSSHIWSRSYDRDLEHLVDMQKEIARAVARELQARLGDQAISPAIDPRAYELFLEAKFFYARRAEGDRERAESRLTEALGLEPEFARGWALLAAVANARLGDPGAGADDPALRAQLLDTQRRAVEKALKYGPKLPEAHQRAAQYYFYNGAREKALEHVEIARAIDPDHPNVLVALAHDLRNSGRIAEASRLVRLNLQRDPLSAALRANLMQDLLWSGRFEDVRPHFEAILDINPSAIEEASFLGRFAAQADILRNDFVEVAAVIELLPEGAERLQALALSNSGQGNGTEAEMILAELTSMAHSSREVMQVAEVYAYRDEREEAMAWLYRIEPDRDCAEELLWQSIYYSPFLARLGDEPGWVDYRSVALDIMRNCRLGLELDSGLPG